MPRSAAKPTGNTTHSLWALLQEAWTFHSTGNAVSGVPDSIKGTVTVTKVGTPTLSNTTGATFAAQADAFTLALTLGTGYSIMWRGKVGSTYPNIDMPFGSGSATAFVEMLNAGGIQFRDSTGHNFTFTIPAGQSLITTDYCLTASASDGSGNYTVKLYWKDISSSTWTYVSSTSNTYATFALNSIGKGDGNVYAGFVGVIEYFQLYSTALTATQLLDLADPYDILTPDTTAPTLVSATIDSTGLLLDLVFSDSSLPILPATGATGLTVSCSGGTQGIESVLRTASTTLTITLTRTVLSTETATCAYLAGNITDYAGNPLATITAASVTNNSTQTSSVPTGASQAVVTTVYIKANDTAIQFLSTLTANGAAIPLTGATVRMLLSEKKTLAKYSIAATILDAAKGKVKCVPNASFPTSPGTYLQEWKIIFGDGGRLTVPTGISPVNAYNYVIIMPELA